MHKACIRLDNCCSAHHKYRESSLLSLHDIPDNMRWHQDQPGAAPYTLHLQAPPMHLLVENVVGFEGSRTRARMVEVLQAAGYAIQVRAA